MALRLSVALGFFLTFGSGCLDTSNVKFSDTTPAPVPPVGGGSGGGSLTLPPGSYSVGSPGQKSPPYVSLGASHSCLLTKSGLVKCWGDNEFGQVGDGTGGDGTHNNDRYVPTVALTTANTPLTNVVSVYAGSNIYSDGSAILGHTCAITTVGDAYCWGDNLVMEIGDGTVNNRGYATRVPGLPAPVQEMALGAAHTCALLVTGQVWCWGNNTENQLGDPIIALRRGPAPVPGITTAKRIVGGSGHTCVQLTDGSISCWGSNASLTLANPGFVGSSTATALNVSLPGPATDLFSNAVNGGFIVNGMLYMWGMSQFGNLAQGVASLPGNSTPIPLPVLVTPMMQLHPVSQAAIGFGHACAIVPSGMIYAGTWCWGLNDLGQLGTGSPSSSVYLAGQVSFGSPGIIANQIAAGAHHTCAVVNTSIYCWGGNSTGQLGLGYVSAPNVALTTPVFVTDGN